MLVESVPQCLDQHPLNAVRTIILFADMRNDDRL